MNPLEQGYYEDYGGGYDFQNDRYGSSLHKMIDEADRLIQGKGLPDDYFLQEEAGIMNQDLVGRFGNIQIENDEMKITPSKIRDIEMNYLLETVEKTRRKRSPKAAFEQEIEQRIEALTEDLEGLENFKIGYNSILDQLLGKEGKVMALEAISEQNEEFKELCEAVQGKRADPEIQNNIAELDRLYKHAIEVGRANLPFETEQKSDQLTSGARHPGSLPQMSSDQQYADNYQLDNQNLDIIYETMNENFTRTNYLNSYQVWTRLDEHHG